MKKRVLLVNPPYPMEESPSPPFGLMSLAAYLIQNGYDVKIDDYIVNPYSLERVRKTVREFDPDLIGSTGVTMNILTALRILADYREASGRAIIVMGGPHVSFDAQCILAEWPHVDVIVRGEGELTTVELLEHLDKKDEYQSVKGISYRNGTRIIHNDSREFIPDINILPYPARHLVQLSKYKALGLPLNMITSRGCPYECIFCVGSKMVGRRVRYYNVERVVDEFEMLSGMGFKQINIVDDLFTSNRKRCIAICDEIIRRGIRQDWTAFARVDTVSRDLLETMRRAGCTTLCFGIESGNQEILDRVKKKITLAKIEKAIRLCRESGVLPMASYIMGLPGESPDTVRETLDFARNLCNSYGFHILAPFPGTEVREKAEEYGLRIFSNDWDRYDANQSVCESVLLPHQEVDRIVNEFNSGINGIIRNILEKSERGESITAENETMVENIKSFDFNSRLINGELVEMYGSNGSTVGGMDTFIDFIADRAGVQRGDASDGINRLFRLGCLVRSGDGDVEIYRWA